MMPKSRLNHRYSNYSKAVSRLHELLQLKETNDYIYDAAIQRFEFTYELAWKLLKAYLEHTGITGVNSPRKAFKEAFASELIYDGDKWMDMLEDRNLTTHTYDEEQARAIYCRIQEYYIHLFIKLRERLKGEILKCDLD
jgi:nucleotidyltransferase substrate binding protein (TIGR01987 family)